MEEEERADTTGQEQGHLQMYSWQFAVEEFESLNGPGWRQLLGTYTEVALSTLVEKPREPGAIEEDG